MVQLLVEAKSRSLLEPFVAARDVTSVGVVLGVGINVLRQVLLLGKVSTANIAYESLKAHVQGDQMPLKAESGGKTLTAPLHGADKGILV